MIFIRNDCRFDDRCYLCGCNCIGKPLDSENGYCFEDCKFVKTLIICDSTFTNPFEEHQRRLNIMSHDLFKRRKSSGLTIRYFYDSQTNESHKQEGKVLNVNVHSLMGDYPSWLLETLNKCMENLYVLSTFRNSEIPGIDKYFGITLERALFVEHEDLPYTARLEQLVSIGYLKGLKGFYAFTKEGLDVIANSVNRYEESSTVFIAMSFDERFKDLQDVLCETINECGYEPIIFTDYQHNNQIVPELIRQIELCKFMVMECSENNLGAYYEAGVAKGLHKDTIMVCNKKSFDSGKDTRPHFDIAQQSFVLWENHDDLKEKLVKRIEATIGLRTNIKKVHRDYDHI